MNQSLLFSRHDTPDIVLRLREKWTKDVTPELLDEAADEIEALRALVERKAQEILELRANQEAEDA